MADPPVYVSVSKMGVKSIFETKYKAKVMETMRKTAIRSLEKSKKLTPKEPRSKADKARPGFYLDGTVEKLLMGEVKGKTMMAAEIRLIIATSPKKKMLFFAPAKAKLEIQKPDKVQGDLLFLIESMMKDVMEKEVLKEMEKRIKDLKP